MHDPDSVADAAGQQVRFAGDGGVGKDRFTERGITMTLEGPDGPSSVVLSRHDCLALAETIASLRPIEAAGDARVDPRAEDGTLRMAAAIRERFDSGSAIPAWVERSLAGTGGETHVARPPAHPVATAGLEAARTAALLRRMEADLDREVGTAGNASRAAATTVGRVLLEVVALARAAWEERARFERAVVEARVEAMKQLAYGAGHEINNPLANIATRAQSLLPGESDPGRRRLLAGIIDQAFRARDMIGGLMLFARPPRANPAPVSASEVVDAAVGSVAPLAAQRGVAVDASPPASAIVGTWDRGQIEEAVRSVLTNAIEAGKAGGCVRIETSLGPSPATCVFTISDDGPGMDRQAVASAFDPFFSGREAGRGIGIGLPKVWRLVEINGGRTLIDSRYGEGTTVSIVLPLEGGKVPASSPA